MDYPSRDGRSRRSDWTSGNDPYQRSGPSSADYGSHSTYERPEYDKNSNRSDLRPDFTRHSNDGSSSGKHSDRPRTDYRASRYADQSRNWEEPRPRSRERQPTHREDWRRREPEPAFERRAGPETRRWDDRQPERSESASPLYRDRRSDAQGRGDSSESHRNGGQEARTRSRASHAERREKRREYQQAGWEGAEKPMVRNGAAPLKRSGLGQTGRSITIGLKDHGDDYWNQLDGRDYRREPTSPRERGQSAQRQSRWDPPPERSYHHQPLDSPSYQHPRAHSAFQQPQDRQIYQQSRDRSLFDQPPLPHLPPFRQGLPPSTSVPPSAPNFPTPEVLPLPSGLPPRPSPLTTSTAFHNSLTTSHRSTPNLPIHEPSSESEAVDDVDAADGERERSRSPSPDPPPVITHRHLTHPFRLLPRSTRFDLPFLSSRYRSDLGPPAKGPYLKQAAVGPCRYISKEKDEDGYDLEDGRKLLVTDLNGALLVRSAFPEGATDRRGPRTTYPRPFASCLMEYLFAVRPADEDSIAPHRPWEAFVWSSARPSNVQEMVETTYTKYAESVSKWDEAREQAASEWLDLDSDERPGRLLGMWTRDDMGLTKQDYGRKAATSKDLSKIIRLLEHLPEIEDLGARFHHPHPYFPVDLSNILLLDDSVGKATLQPFNHLSLPEYSNDDRAVAMDMLHRMETRNGPQPERFFDGSTFDRENAVDERVHLLEAAFGEPRDFYQYYVVGRYKFVPGMDIALLGIIGILSEVADVEAIPAWIAAGGLVPDVSETFTEETASQGWATIVSSDLGFDEEPAVAATAALQADFKDPTDHRPPTLMPTQEGFMQWFEDPATLLYWVRRGLVALEDNRIPLAAGVSVEGWLDEMAKEKAAAREKAEEGGYGQPRDRFNSQSGLQALGQPSSRAR